MPWMIVVYQDINQNPMQMYTEIIVFVRIIFDQMIQRDNIFVSHLTKQNISITIKGITIKNSIIKNNTIKSINIKIITH